MVFTSRYSIFGILMSLDNVLFLKQRHADIILI